MQIPQPLLFFWIIVFLSNIPVLVYYVWIVVSYKSRTIDSLIALSLFLWNVIIITSFYFYAHFLLK